MINASEFTVIAVLLVIVVGPEKLPELAAQLGRVVRELKAIATGAKRRVEEELGPDFDELKSLDPRQYDPRRIVRDALSEPPVHRSAQGPGRTATPPSQFAKPTRPGVPDYSTPPSRAGGTTGVSGAAGAAGVAGAAATTGTAEAGAERPLPPFDPEAT
ncbi:MAG: twin-arginine translocase TatA/TatE family subunit [Flaviflexus sp.]|nr:twin-arginine translocase TatA/TatE family subunit [Flaviflexus sp.]